MKLSITGRNLVVTPAIREFTEERLERIERALEGVSEAHVILVKEKYRHIAEVVVKGKNLVLSGTQATEDMYNSIGKALEKIEHQARKHREKMILARRRSGRKSPGNNGGGAEEVVEEVVVATLPGERLMVRDDDYPHKPMTVEEAAFMLQDGAGEFLVFRDSATQRVGVVYHRADGHLGLILPEE